MKKKHHIIKKEKYHIPIFGGTIIFILTDNIKYVYDKYKLTAEYHETDEVDTECLVIDHRTKEGFQRIFVIFVLPNLNLKIEKIINLLGHELRHIVNNIGLYRGLSFSKNKDEHMSYLQGQILEEMFKFIKSYIKN